MPDTTPSRGSSKRKADGAAATPTLGNGASTCFATVAATAVADIPRPIRVSQPMRVHARFPKAASFGQGGDLKDAAVTSRSQRRRCKRTLDSCHLQSTHRAVGSVLETFSGGVSVGRYPRWDYHARKDCGGVRLLLTK